MNRCPVVKKLFVHHFAVDGRAMAYSALSIVLSRTKLSRSLLYRTIKQTKPQFHRLH